MIMAMIYLNYIILQMINHHTILKEELRKIGNAINKKYPTLRKEVIKTSEVFDNEQIPVFPYEVCFGLFREIKDTGSLSSSMAFLPFLQSIINLGFSNADMSREILTLLTQIKQIPKFPTLENEIKIQQILAVLVSKNCIDLQHLSFTHSLFNVVLSLENSKYKSLWQKSASILLQTLTLLVNDYRDNPTEDRLSSLHEFFNDLIKIVGESKPKWLIQVPELYLILQILAQTLEEKNFIEDPERVFGQQFSELFRAVRKQLRKCIETAHLHLPTSKGEPSSSSPNPKWQLPVETKILILMRVGCRINMTAKLGYQILEQIIKIISDKRLSLIKVIAYEGMNSLFRNSAWMFNLFQSEHADLFNFLFTTEFNTVKFLISDQREKIDLNAYYTNQDTNYNKIMGGNSIDLNVMEFSCSHEIKMIVRNLEEVTYALYYIYSQHYGLDMNERIQGKPPLEKTYKFCQKTVFETIKAILPRDMSEDTLQSLLKISEKFIHMAGCFNDPSVSAIYIKLMCKYCLPAQFKNISHRHIQINKMILNTVNCLGHLLTSSCWVIVWKALENYSIYYNRYLLGKEELQSARESDVQILYKSMDSIFTESAKYKHDYLLEIIRSLIEVAYECLENNYNDETRKIFAFERIEQIYKLNLFRVCVIWPQLSSSLLCITTSKVLYFRLSALALLNTLIPMSLNYLKNHQEALAPPFTSANYEELIMEPWINLVNCQFQEIKDELVVAVNKLIIDYGHILTHGWKCIMEIVKKTNDLKSLQAIVETFLEKVHDYIMDVIVCVDRIERKLTDTNQKYLCLTMIWSVADYARKNDQFEVLKKIYQILLVPEEMFNLGTEARHSSFYIFAEIVVHNCIEKDPEFWVWIFGEISKFYSYGINECISAKDKTFGEEALKNLLANLIKVYKKFFKVSKQWANNEIELRLLSDFYNFCSLIIQFRSPEIYQTLFKQIKQLLYPKIKQSVTLKQFPQFIESISQIYFVENDPKILKCLITYLPADIYDLLTNCLDIMESNFAVVYKLVEKIYLLRLEAQEKEIKLAQLRIFFEDKYHYEFMKKMQGYVMEERPQIAELYVESLCKTLQKLKLYDDFTSMGKSLPFLTNINLKFPEVLPKRVLDTINIIIRARFEDNWINTVGSTKEIPIWYMCMQDLMKVSHDYLEKGCENGKLSYCILRDTILEQNAVQIERYSPQIACYYYQSEIQICHFLFQNYYFSSQDPLVESEPQDLVEVVKLISRRSEQIAANDSTKKGNNAYQLLLKLAACRDENGYSHRKIEVGQSVVIGYAFQRICKTFDKVKPCPNDPLVFEELKFVLKQLLSFKLKAGVLRLIEQNLAKTYLNGVNINAKALNIPEAHLFFFQPLLAKCIKCQDADSLDLIQAILEKAASILLNLD